tara:strand:- start:2619 stop:3245 length:627 start_codon:yes stop_codon:yes gene_type:complete
MSIMANIYKNLGALGTRALNLVSEGGLKKMTKREAILDYHNQYPNSTAKQIAKAIGCNRNYVYIVWKEEFNLAKNVNPSSGINQLTITDQMPLDAEVHLAPKTELEVMLDEELFTPNDMQDAVSISLPLTTTTLWEEAVSDGSTAAYYELPEGCSELQHLISYKDMNSQVGEIFRSCYRYGESSHSDKLRDAKKIKFYINAEIERLTR